MCFYLLMRNSCAESATHARDIFVERPSIRSGQRSFFRTTDLKLSRLPPRSPLPSRLYLLCRCSQQPPLADDTDKRNKGPQHRIPLIPFLLSALSVVQLKPPHPRFDCSPTDYRRRVATQLCSVQGDCSPSGFALLALSPLQQEPSVQTLALRLSFPVPYFCGVL
jgi:hypothetical protein